MGGAYFVLLSSLVLTVTVQAQQCPRPQGSHMTLKDEYILLDEFLDGVTVAFACDFGYVAKGGNGKITCTNGNWSPLSLICQRKSCGPAGEVENGFIDYSGGIEFGDKVTVTCNRGYYLVGNKELTCGDGKWLNRLPVCEVIECDPPSKIVNGTFGRFKESYAYGEVVKYTCREDNALNGSDTLSCSDGGNFLPNPPKCVYVECAEPVVDDGKWKDGSRPPYRYKSTVTFECEKGFHFEGGDTIICGMNSQWSPVPPKCIRDIVTTKPTTTTKTTTTTTTNTTAPLDRTPDTNTPSDTPDIHWRPLTWWEWLLSLFGIGGGVAAAVGGGKVVHDKYKKGKRISHQEKSANNGGAELRQLNPSANGKDEAAEQNSIP